MERLIMPFFPHSKTSGFRWKGPWSPGLCLVKYAALCLVAGCALQAATTVFHLDNASGRSWHLADLPEGTGCTLKVQANGPGQWEAAPGYQGRILPGASLRLTMESEPHCLGLQLKLTAPPASPLFLDPLNESPSRTSDTLRYTLEPGDTLSFRRVGGPSLQSAPSLPPPFTGLAAPAPSRRRNREMPDPTPGGGGRGAESPWFPDHGTSSSSSSSSSSAPLAVPVPVLAPAPVVFLRNASRQPWSLTYPKTGVALPIPAGEAVKLHWEESDDEGELALDFTDSLGQNIPRLAVVLSATRAEVATLGALSQLERNLMTSVVNRDPLVGDGDLGYVILADTCAAAAELERKGTEQEEEDRPFAALLQAINSPSSSPTLASPTWGGGHRSQQAPGGGEKRRRLHIEAKAPEHNPQERAYECAACKIQIMGRSAYMIHKKAHPENYPFTCRKCDYLTDNKSNIYRHEKKCAGIKKPSSDPNIKKQHSCKICDYGTANRSSLYRHNLTHTGVKPHACSQCGIKFTTRSNLNAHIMRTSKPTNKWECEYCHHSFVHEKIRDRHREKDCQKGRSLPQATSSSNPTWPEASTSSGGGGETAGGGRGTVTSDTRNGLPVEIVEICAKEWGVTCEVAERHLANGTEPGDESDPGESETGEEG
jgi:hypothetical protein